MVTPFLPLAFFMDEFFSDMFFVALVLTGSYILYILYINFHDQPMIFALAAIAGATFLLSNSLLTMALVTLFFVFVMFGQNLQMILSFAVYPILRTFNVEVPGEMPEEQREAMKLQQIEQRILKGEDVSAAEKSQYADSLSQQADMQQKQQQMANQMMRRR
ncbi:MAG: hypothetical protein WCX64_01810 [Candidatus Micrarchaeia archaeon]